MNGLEIIEQIAVGRIPYLVLCCIILGTFFVLIPTFVVYLLTKDWGRDKMAVDCVGIDGVKYTLRTPEQLYDLLMLLNERENNEMDT